MDENTQKAICNKLTTLIALENQRSLREIQSIFGNAGRVKSDKLGRVKVVYGDSEGDIHAAFMLLGSMPQIMEKEHFLGAEEKAAMAQFRDYGVFKSGLVAIRRDESKNIVLEIGLNESTEQVLESAIKDKLDAIASLNEQMSSPCNRTNPIADLTNRGLKIFTGKSL